jgi:hypothetical protein
MKLKRESKEVDLYVDPKRPTEKEMQELSEFIEQVKLKQQQKKSKHRKAA